MRSQLPMMSQLRLLLERTSINSLETVRMMSFLSSTLLGVATVKHLLLNTTSLPLNLRTLKDLSSQKSMQHKMKSTESVSQVSQLSNSLLKDQREHQLIMTEREKSRDSRLGSKQTQLPTKHILRRKRIFKQ